MKPEDATAAMKEQNQLAIENFRLRAALIGVWKWQRSIQEMMPDVLADEIRGLLGEETIAKLFEERT